MKRVSFFLGLAVGIGVLLSLNAMPARAQTASSGSVTGSVSDPQGASVPGADVTLVDPTTKGTQTATTNDSGRYNFPVVHPGLYEIIVSKQGFKVAKLTEEKVSLGLVLTVNVTLEVGTVSETVVITSGSGTELQSANATIGVTLTLKELELLPNLSRDASTLMALQPGVTPTGFVAGAFQDQNSFSIDGGNNTDDMAGNTISYIQNFTGTGGTQLSGMASGIVFTPIESVEEFRVNTFGQTADYNNGSGAEVKMVTKRGTDQFHGSGYGYYFAPNVWGANTWRNNHTTSNKGIPTIDPVTGPRNCAPGTTLQKGDTNCVLPYTPIFPSHRNRFGFTFGGPMIPFKVLGGKTYVFVNYEGFRFANVVNFTRSYPTAALRAGVIQVQNDSKNPVTYLGVTYAAGAWIPFNLNPNPVTVQVGNPNDTKSPLQTVTLPSALCGTATTLPCDPRQIGLNPIVSQIWQKFLPLPNSPSGGDNFNTQGYVSTVANPITSNNYVGRIDHDFGAKHRFFTSFRASKLLNVPNNIQVDVGGLLGGTLGQYKNVATQPQLGELWVIGLTSSLSPTITNDLRLSYLWNWWQWGTKGGPPQLPGLGGAVEIAPVNASNAESTAALIPYNVNTQQVRQRTWDGQDKMLRDDVTWIKGNHLLQMGGLLQKNYMFHDRSDNGVGVNNQITYQIASQSIDWTNPNFIPKAITDIGGSSANPYYTRLASVALGLVGLPQVAYARAGSDLHLLPVGASAFDQSTVKTYSLYFTDTWHIKPNVTISFGANYIYETPPVEKNGKQVALVYQDGTLVDTVDYLAKRKSAALAGQVYNPILGFETTGNLHLKYPYTPFKRGLSPRFSIAWNPQYKSGFLGKVLGEGKTVFRAGVGRVYGRLNGVDLVLVPLLGVGLLQSVSCPNSLMPAAPGLPGTCASSSVNPSNVFRIGTDGLVAPLPAASATLPQPFFTGGDNPIAQDATVLDPRFRPVKTDNIDFTIQRQLGSKMAIEVGYMGRRIRNIYTSLSLDAVPYMTTLGGQQFKQAWANLWLSLCAPGLAGACTQLAGATTTSLPGLLASVPNQPFFESALGGPGSAYCRDASNNPISCTQALLGQSGVRSLISNNAPSQFWQYLYTTGTSRANGTLGSWILPRSMISAPLLKANGTLGAGQATLINMTTSLGFANYNAGFLTFRVRDWHDLSGATTVTWGRALGTSESSQASSSRTVLDAWNIGALYGPQQFDYKVLVNSGMAWQPQSFFGLVDFRSKKGVLGHLLKGWTIAPFFSYQSGPPDTVSAANGSSCTGCQSFGEVTPPGGDSSNGDRAVLAVPYTGGNNLHRGIQPTTGAGSSAAASKTDLNQFADPQAILNQYRRCVLGIDTGCGGFTSFRDIPVWNLDATLAKDFRFGERISLRASIQFTNVLNHFAPGAPSTTITSASSWGVINGQATTQRQTEFGLRLSF